MPAARVMIEKAMRRGGLNANDHESCGMFGKRSAKSMPAEGNCIVLHKVNQYFGHKQVLRDITLKIPYGSIYGLLGPSGCGKTTTVKIMSGILQATSGEVLVLGQPMPELTLMTQIGYMAQSDALYASLSAYENLAFFASLYGMKKAVSKERIYAVMALMNLTEELHQTVATYSGGMKRRLSLAMAVLHEPKLLILDEPTVGIDPVLRKTIWQELYRLAQEGVTIVVTTHVMDEAEKCHQLAMMRNGRLIAAGSPLKLREQIHMPSLEEAFIYYGGADDEN